jgi:hypothetical protein
VLNAETLTTRQVVRMIFEEIGKPPKIGSMGSSCCGSGYSSRQPRWSEMMYEFEEPFSVEQQVRARFWQSCHAAPHSHAAKPRLVSRAPMRSGATRIAYNIQN